MVGGLMLSGTLSGALASWAIVAPPDTRTACDAQVEVRAVDLGTGEALANFAIEVRDAAGPREIRTGPAGVITVEQVCAGEVEVRAGRLDYRELRRELQLAAGARASVELSLEPVAIDRIDDVVVYAPAPYADSMASAQSLDAQQLRENQGAGLATKIEALPGVSALRSSAGGGVGKPIIRGQVGRRNLLIFDGVRHEGQKWGLEHAPEIDAWSAGDLTVIKGAATTRFGADAVGGVVLIDPVPMPRTPGVRGFVGMVGDSNPLGGGVAARVDGAHELTKGLAWRVEGNVGRYRAPLTPDYPLDNGGSFVWNAGARLGYFDDAFDVEFAYRRHDAELGICSCVRLSTQDEFIQAIELQRPVGVEFYSAEFDIERAKQAVQHDLAMARTRVNLRKGILHAQYAWQFNNRDEFDVVRQGVTGPQLAFDLTTHTGQLRYEQPALPVGRRFEWLGTVGASAAHQVNAFDANVNLVPDYRQPSGGVFAVQRLAASRVEFELGARYEGLQRRAALNERDFLGQRAGGRLDEEACVRRDDGGADCTQSFHTGSGSAGVLVKPVLEVPEFTLRLDANSSARIPSIDEQFMNGAAPSFPILGIGSSLNGVERTWGSALAATFASDWLWAEAAAYVNYIDQYLYFAGAPQEGQCAPLTCTARGPMPVFEFSPVDALFAGGELGATYRPRQAPIELRGNGAWVRAQNLDAEPGASRALSFIPPDRYGLALRYLWPAAGRTHGGFVGLDSTFVARQRIFDPEVDFADPPAGYVLLGAAAGIIVEAPGARVHINAAGHNLLNQRYRDYTSLLRYFADAPGWGVQLRVGVEFGPRDEYPGTAPATGARS